MNLTSREHSPWKAYTTEKYVYPFEEQHILIQMDLLNVLLKCNSISLDFFVSQASDFEYYFVFNVNNCNFKVFQ